MLGPLEFAWFQIGGFVEYASFALGIGSLAWHARLFHALVLASCVNSSEVD
jgi:hypothetical protein